MKALRTFGKSAVRAVIPLHESEQLARFFNTVITILFVEGRCLEIDVTSFFINLSSECRVCRPARVLSPRVQTQDDEPAPCPSVKAATALTYAFTLFVYMNYTLISNQLH